MSEIKHKITNLLNGIENDEIQYDELKSIRDYILQDTVSKEDVFLFFDLLHLFHHKRRIHFHVGP